MAKKCWEKNSLDAIDFDKKDVDVLGYFQNNKNQVAILVGRH